jgi:catechol 2,3-dioxygenase-like lactoylglutathione lyase family enzyme
MSRRLFKGVEHVGIYVSDLKRSLEFYNGLLGFPVVRDVEVKVLNLHVVFLDAGGFLIELLEPHEKGGYARPPRNYFGLRQICLLVEDLQLAYEKLKARGIEFIEPPLEIVPGQVSHAVFLDPDGVHVELLQRHVPMQPGAAKPPTYRGVG